jgi:HAD superfamily hydrolase (TIGR01490 family)
MEHEFIGEKRNIAAFFDFDGTLFTGHLWQGIVKHHIKHKVKLVSVLMYLATNFPLAFAGELASKINITGEEWYKIKWGEDLATLLKGFKKEEVIRIFQWITDNYFMKLLRPDVMALLQRHRNENHITVLLSGSFSDFLEIIKQELDIDYIVGTKLEVINDVYSGRIIKPLCFGINKAKLLEEFISQARLNIDFGLSFAYADSVLDAPILQLVGNPVATYPDRELLTLAKRRGWQILPSSYSPESRQTKPR